jgi:6-pyruvoyltetrahydropterin/6-carboxytetrahydropterin synthase
MPRNTFAGLPTGEDHGLGLAAHVEIDVACRGMPDPATGYLVNIAAIDRAVRSRVIPLFTAAARSQPAPGGEGGTRPTLNALLKQIVAQLREEFGDMLAWVRWRSGPYHSLAMTANAIHQVSITQSFEFSAAHRLHVDALDAAANRGIFGKCNNPSGHGHNYRVEVTARTASDDSAAGRLTLAAMEAIVMEQVIDRFDHKHLNLDTREFATLNPSVENIARVCHELLNQPIAAAGGQLERVRVWETEKTSCTYPAGA